MISCIIIAVSMHFLPRTKAAWRGRDKLIKIRPQSSYYNPCHNFLDCVTQTNGSIITQRLRALDLGNKNKNIQGDIWYSKLLFLIVTIKISTHKKRYEYEHIYIYIYISS